MSTQSGDDQDEIDCTYASPLFREEHLGMHHDWYLIHPNDIMQSIWRSIGWCQRQSGDCHKQNDDICFCFIPQGRLAWALTDIWFDDIMQPILQYSWYIMQSGYTQRDLYYCLTCFEESWSCEPIFDTYLWLEVDHC